MANVTAWLERVLAIPEVIERFGKVKFCQKAIQPIFKVEEKKVEAKPQPKKEEPKPAAEKKEENPLDVLPPTSFNLYDFKTFFVNEQDKRGAGMKAFKEQYDKEGYSIYHLKYEKYEGEGTVLYQFANLRNGFLQRIDHFRKHAFATYIMLGEEPNLEIEGVWLFRGKGIPQEMKDHPQFEYHQVKELSLDNEADFQLITDFWCSKEGEKINGQLVQDTKMHK